MGVCEDLEKTYLEYVNANDLQAWFDAIETRVVAAYSQDPKRYYDIESSVQWVADAESALEQVFLESHAIRKQWATHLDRTASRPWDRAQRITMDSLRAIFRSANDQLRAGRIKTLADGVHANDVGELLEQAEQLSKAGHYLAAAVLAGGALETTLHHLCRKANLVISGHGAIAKYQQAMAQSRKAGVEIISSGYEKQVIA